MIKHLLALITLFSAHAFAAEGVVKVLEAPLFRTEDITGPVIQHVRKGDKIYIHDSALRGADYVPMDTVFNDSNNDSNNEIIVTPKKTGGDFYATIDNQGRVAYIPKKYIDVTYKDERELEHEKFAKDPTDYRLKEPLPKEYPIYNPSGYKSFFALGLGPHPKNNYQYSKRIRKEKFSNSVDLTGMLAMKAKRDQRDRFYYGGMFQFFKSESSFELEGGSAEESEMKVGIGPYLSYDPFVGETFKFTVYTALIYNFFNMHGVTQNTDTNFSEARVYSGATFSPRFGFIVNFTDIYPDRMDQVDFLVGVSLMSEYPRRLTSSQQPKLNSLWQSGAGDQINNAFLTATLSIGLQKRF